MDILVVDGQGGRIGQQLVRAILARFPGVEVSGGGHQQPPPPPPC